MQLLVQMLVVGLDMYKGYSFIRVYSDIKFLKFG